MGSFVSGASAGYKPLCTTTYGHIKQYFDSGSILNFAGKNSNMNIHSKLARERAAGEGTYKKTSR